MIRNMIWIRAVAFFMAASVLMSAATTSGAQERSYMEQLSVDEGLPHTDVSSIVQDGDGYIWIGTYSGLCRYDGAEMTVYDISNSILESSRIRSLFLASDGLLYIGTETGGLTIFDTLNDRFVKTVKVPSNYVNGIFPSFDGHSVIICTDDGISTLSCHDGIYDLSSRSFGCPASACFPLGEDELLVGTPSALEIFCRTSGARTRVKDIFATSFLKVGERLLITSYEGCWLFDMGDRSLSQLNGCAAKYACMDGEGNIYVGTVRDGLLRYDASLRQTGQFLGDSRRTPEISCLLMDRSDVLWEGTVGGGCYRSNANSRKFRMFTVTPDTEGEQVVAMMADSRDRLWLSSREGRVAVMQGGRIRQVNPQSLSRFAGKTVSALWQSPEGDVWVGSWDRGAAVIAAEHLERAASGGAFPLAVPGNLPSEASVYKFASDPFGCVWVVTGDGLYRSAPNGLRAPATTSWTRLRREPSDPNTLADDCITDILVEDGTVWVGSRSGLNRIDLDGDGNITGIERLRIRPDDGAGEFISFIHRDSRGSLWVSVLGLGLCRMEADGSFTVFNKATHPEFPNNEFESMLEDGAGNFWIGGFGLVRFSPQTGKISCFSRKDGLQSNAFKMYDAVWLSDGRMAFGGINGFNVFSPSEITDNTDSPEVRLTSLLINGSHCDSLLRDGIPVRKRESLKLRSTENNLLFRFSAMHYVYPERNRFRYRMRGLDEDWHLTDGTAPFASYLSLRPGRYTFVVYASNSDGLWSDVPASIELRILPPWYASAAALACYILLVLAAAAGVAAGLHRRSVRRHREELEDKLREEQRERNENELKFHTDFLHEIRTPLTLITTPVEELLKNPNLGKTTLNRLQLVDQSAKILQKHIESITDLRKYDNGEVRLHVVEIDFSRFVEEICLLFQPIARTRGYEFAVKLNPLSQKLFIDKDSIEKVILNLMSNAVKYSPDRGGR